MEETGRATEASLDCSLKIWEGSIRSNATLFSRKEHFLTCLCIRLCKKPAPSFRQLEAALDGFPRRVAVVIIALATALSTLAASESPQQAFVKRWEGQSVVVKQTLYTLVYNERGRLGNTRTG